MSSVSQEANVWGKAAWETMVSNRFLDLSLSSCLNISVHPKVGTSFSLTSSTSEGAKIPGLQAPLYKGRGTRKLSRTNRFVILIVL